MQPVDPTYPAMVATYEGATGIPYPWGLAAITELLFGGEPGADER